MLKTKSIKILSAAIVLALAGGNASAALVADTTPFPDGAAIPLDTGNWAAGYFFVNSSVCSNGCDITGAKLLLDLAGGYDNTPFSNVTLELVSNAGSASNPVLGQSLFTLTNPATATHSLISGRLGTFVDFTAAAQNQNLPALLQPNTGYWLKLTNAGQPISFGWFFDGFQQGRTDQVLAFYDGFDTISAAGNPLIFQVTGDNSATPRLAPAHVPIPGAVWMMSSALLGFTIAGRRKKTN